MEIEVKKPNWFKKHMDMLVIVGMILVASKWADGKFDKINDRFTSIEKDITQVKTVLIIRGWLPESMAAEEKK
jgi:hypothetical protein